MNNAKSLAIENSGYFVILNLVGSLLSSLKGGQPIDPLIVTLTIIATVLNAASSYIRGVCAGAFARAKERAYKRAVWGGEKCRRRKKAAHRPERRGKGGH